MLFRNRSLFSTLVGNNTSCSVCHLCICMHTPQFAVNAFLAKMSVPCRHHHRRLSPCRQKHRKRYHPDHLGKAADSGKKVVGPSRFSREKLYQLYPIRGMSQNTLVPV
jgi:hypothetical protein